MRETLFEAALVLMTHSRKWSWLKAWGMKIARHRGMKRAIVAVARRLAVIHASHVGRWQRVSLER
jgi:transposase